MAIPGPTATALSGHTVIGLYFSADWCTACSSFTPVLIKLYTALKALGDTQLEVVVVPRCRTAKATKHHCEDMPWLSLWHGASDEAAVTAQTSMLMAKFGITSIPTLVLLDAGASIICADAREHCVADPEGLSFPWRQWAPITAPTKAINPPACAVRRGLVVNFDLPPWSRLRPEPSCARPTAFGGESPGTILQTASLGLPVGRLAGKGVGTVGTAANTPLAAVGSPLGRPVRGRRGPASTVTPTAPAPLALGGTDTRVPQRPSSKRKSPLAAEAMRPPPPPKPNFDGIARAREQWSAPPEGKPTSLMQPQPLAAVHPFTPTLNEWRHGIQVDCGPSWSWDVIEAAVARGPHPTARTPEAIALFEEDIEYQRRAGFCKIIPWEELKLTRPPNLKISPVAAVPQVGRRPRIILDLSFPVYQNIDGAVTATQQSVNDTTTLHAPKTAVREIGKVLPRLLTYMRDTPAGLHILMSKLDISDGFWRLIVRNEDSFNFAYVLPQRDGEPIRIVVPSAVQMGWIESPSLFCAVTETARDLAQHFVDAAIPLPPHHVESSMAIEEVPMRARAEAPSKLLQVYVDDFCYAATQSKDGVHIPTIRRAAIHGIEALFPPPTVTKHTDGKPPISVSKLLKGDGRFESKKDMIGFSFDGIKRTVHLPPQKAAAYIKETRRLLRRKSVPLKILQGVVGKMRHASIILPAARGFFTPINAAMRGTPKCIVLGAKSEVRAALEDLCTLLHILASRPTHVKELVPDMPQYVGYHDAAAEGAGGVWFSLLSNMSPTVWRVAFPHDIKSEVITDDNPTGLLTNSDLELAAEVMAVGVALVVAHTIKHVPLGTLCDNTPTVSWIEKMASKSQGPTSGRLLRGLAVMLHSNRAGRLTTVHVPGADNVLADVASRPAKAQKMFMSETPLSDTAFRSSFDIAFPLPDNQAWTLAEVPPWMKLCVFETLRGKRLDLRRWTGPSVPVTGERGRRTAGSTLAAPDPTQPRARKPTDSSPLLSPCGKATTAWEIKSRFSQSSGLSGMSPKNLFWTDTLTPAEHPPDNTPLTSQ